MMEEKRKQKTYLRLAAAAAAVATLTWLGVGDWLMLKVGSLVVVVVVDGCYGSGGGCINKVSNATSCYASPSHFRLCL